MRMKDLKYMTKEEFCKKNPYLTDSDKEKYDELCKRGWVDVAQAYWNYCKESDYRKFLRNYLSFLESRKETRGIYKNGEHMTKEQTGKWEKLIEMGWRRVAMAYSKACEEENYSEAYQIKLKYGWFEGVGMDADEL